jgi:hypothetical protein
MTDARKMIADILQKTDPEQDPEWDYSPQSDAILSALTSSGYRILGPDELDAVTVEKCAEVASSHFDLRHADKARFASLAIATAIRSLCATQQGDR